MQRTSKATLEENTEDTDEVINPTPPKKQKKDPLASEAQFIIFLDIDGVIYKYSDSTQSAIYKRIQILFPNAEKPWDSKLFDITTPHFFDKAALTHLDYLIHEIEKTRKVGIVLSSNWHEKGSVEELKSDFFGMHSFSKYIIDKTPEKIPDQELSTHCRKKKEPRASQCRAAEIHYWLEKHPEIIDFAILDDIDNHLSANFPQNFFKVDMETLLTKEVADRILLQDKEKSKA